MKTAFFVLVAFAAFLAGVAVLGHLLAGWLQ